MSVAGLGAQLRVRAVSSEWVGCGDVREFVDGVADIVLSDALRRDAYLVGQHRQLRLRPVHATILVSHGADEERRHTDTDECGWW